MKKDGQVVFSNGSTELFVFEFDKSPKIVVASDTIDIGGINGSQSIDVKVATTLITLSSDGTLLFDTTPPVSVDVTNLLPVVSDDNQLIFIASNDGNERIVVVSAIDGILITANSIEVNGTEIDSSLQLAGAHLSYYM